MKKATTLALAITALTLTERPATAQEHTWHLIEDAIGCPSEDSEDKLMSFVYQHDLVAANKYAALAGCQMHKAGESGHLCHASFMSGFICLRFPGETEGLFFIQERAKHD